MKKWLILVGLAILLIAIGFAVLKRTDPLRSNERRIWKQKSIAEIAVRVTDPAWPSNELARLKTQRIGESSTGAGWLSDHIIVTRKGEWLAYANVCRKEDRRIHDIFLARGSDGRWYYSTYHFCVGMIVLRMNKQPEDLTEFAEAYFLRIFDGQSEDCLKMTWPPLSR